MLGLVLEIPSRLRKRANLVCTLSRYQLLYRVRLEAVVQGRDFSGQTVDEQLGHLRFPPGGVRITDRSKCPPQLVYQHGPDHGRNSAQLGLGDDRRYSSEVSHCSSLRREVTRSVLCRSSEYV
jgi:hypothetical protein